MRITHYLILWILILLPGAFALGQNYTSQNNGSWTAGSNWTNTSGWGASTPSVSGGHSSGTATVNHNLTVAGNYALASATLLINSGASVTVGTDFSVGGGGTVNVYGTLIVYGNVTLNSVLNIYPGGQVIVHGSVTVVSSNNLRVGTAVAPPPYADLVIYQNLISQTSGDVTINRNGRVAVFGNVSAAGGGTLLTVNNGGQAYVHGNVNFTGGGSHIVNNNTTNPYGLYVNGTVTNSGGGSSTSSNTANLATLQATNVPFYNWLQSIPLSPMPIELLYLKAIAEDGEVSVRWATASELNLDYFELEHSVNGTLFQSIARLDGSGTDSYETRTYSHTHSNPHMGPNYYRLKSVDHDGTYQYSAIVSASSNSRPSLVIYPIPARDHFTVKSNFDPGPSDRVEVVSADGTVLSIMRPDGSPLHITVDPQWKPGIYYVRYSGVIEETVRVAIR